MSRQQTYGEALAYLRNITPREGVRPLHLSWMDVVCEYDDLPRDVRQALINRLIDLQKDTTAREEEERADMRERYGDDE